MLFVVAATLGAAVATPSATRACSWAITFEQSVPPSGSTLPEGVVQVALFFGGGYPADQDTFEVHGPDGEPLPVTPVRVQGGVLLRFDTTGVDEISIHGPRGTFSGESDELVTFDVAPPLEEEGVPPAPSVTVDAPTCAVCPSPLDSCCVHHDTDGRWNSVVHASTSEGHLVGWLNDQGRLAGIFPGAFQTDPEFLGPYALPRVRSDVRLVAISVRGQLSTAVDWDVSKSGPCHAGGGCAAAGRGSSATPLASGLLMALLGTRRWRRRAR